MCNDRGFRQLVKEPTRINHLLDLVLSDLDESVLKATVLPQIADHNLVLLEVDINLMSSPPVERTVWLYDSANWTALRSFFASTNWSWLRGLDSDSAAEELTDFILSSAKNFIESFFEAHCEG